jgi:hypothetical protein
MEGVAVADSRRVSRGELLGALDTIGVSVEKFDVSFGASS